MSCGGYIPPLRLGVFGEGTMFGDPVQERKVSAAWTGEGTAIMNMSGGGYLDLIITGELVPFSTLWGAVDVITPPADSMWEFSMSGGAVYTSTITLPMEHERTPVKYVRKDDLTLSYAGDQLTTVTKESGDTLLLTYDGDGNLIGVEDNYTNLKKVLSYDGNNRLTGVIKESV